MSLLGTKYSESMKASFTDANGKIKISLWVVMESVLVGLAAAIKQNNDDKGICLPSAIAPFEVVVIQADKKDDNVFKISEKIYEMLKDKNYDVALDDRVESQV